MTEEAQTHSRTYAKPERGVESTISRSLRVPIELWEAAQAKAAADGVLTNRVITELLEGYVHGVYKLPTSTTLTVTKTYPPQPAV
ncbi:hypothetical protein [Agrococcus sp. TSP3-2-1]|uniref:hypothetical protein n=1 Tax=Agrococcus sp. TSP3-2-1 TaxID=2804583 RepID=UPI003CF50803